VQESAFETKKELELSLEEEENTLEENTELEIVVVTEQDYLEALDKLILVLNEKRKLSAATALKINNSFFEDNKIILELSKHESLMFDEIRIDMLHFFRSELKCPQLQLEFVVVAKASKKAKAFTSKDKLDAMKAKNPAIDKLFDSFNLEIDD
jgi:DNA polymerase III subunit gamma/tau